MCNVRGMNNSTKQENILRSKVHLWIANKFNGVCVFTSGLDSEYLGSGIVIVINSSLTKHVYKVFEVPSQLLSIRFFFKNKLSVLVLGLYTGVLSGIQFLQIGKINSLITKTVNESFFIVLGSNFNEDGLQKCASFKKHINLGLVNSLMDINVVVDRDVIDVRNHFDTDHQAVFVSFKDTTAANAAMFSDNFTASKQSLDLDESSRFHKLELLVLKITKAFYKEDVDKFTFFMDYWNSLNSVKASIVQEIVNFGVGFDQLAEFLRAKKSRIRSAIDKQMENFAVNKVVLDHLVVEDKLILEPDLVKTKVDYVFNDAFSTVMCSVSFDELIEKYYDKLVLNMLLVLLNFCLSHELTTCKILFKIFSDRIFLACSFFNILYENNFSVLKGTTTQSLIFVIGLVIKNAYNSVRWEHLRNSLFRIKMCNKFIRFFGNIHNGCVNRVITDFGLTNRYQVHNSLDQKKIGSSQAAIQHIFNVVNKFFRINDIFINNNKTVVILINCRITCPKLSISDLSIFIAKKEESYHYLEIFLLTKSLLKPSLAKANSNVKFFTNLVLRKTIFDKQFSYLVLAVFYSIVSYRTWFIFVPIGVYNKWNSLIYRGLKLKFSLLLNFSNDALYHSLLYGLKTFEQVQAESKVAFVMCFANSVEILGWLFLHRSYDLQVLSWSLLHLLMFSAHIKISASNKFLAGMVCIFFGYGLFLNDHVNNSFHFYGGTSMLSVFGKTGYFKFLLSLQRYGIAFIEQLHGKNGAKKLNLCGPIPEWFRLSVNFLEGVTEPFDILESSKFGLISGQLLGFETDSFSVYTDGSLKGLGSIDMRANAMVFFENISLSLGVRVFGLMSSILAELQIITLVFECVPSNCSVSVFMDNQAVLNVCKLELGLHIVNIIRKKDLSVNWHKIKSYLGVVDNKHADALADAAFLSSWCFILHVKECRILAGRNVIFGNSRHFVHEILLQCAVSYCGEIKVSNYVFSCVIDNSVYCNLLDAHVIVWSALSGLSVSFLSVSQFLFACTLNVAVCTALCKGFVFKEWLWEATSVFGGAKIAGQRIIEFVCNLCLTFRDKVWLVCAKHHAYMEKSGMILCDGSASVLVTGLPAELFVGIVKLLSITKAIGIGFGFRKSCLFFSGVGDSVLVHIGT
ncbi:hypothetical protein G9A89_009794 [Geosiphon pyriformis]|nr:hypothetical protein G9A89_009794 [Geosiphon pyriformis]